MTTIKSILVPIDFSGASSAAIDLAVDMARSFDAEVTLLHAWELPVYPYMEFMLSSAELVTSVEQGANAQLARVLESLRPRVPRCKAVLKLGAPWQQILAAIGELKPDLVVMGTHGRHGFMHAMLGSVAEKVLRLAAVPVLTVHPQPAK